MSETMTLEDLAPLKGEPPARVYVKKVDAQGRAYATGKRKDAVARVWVKPGAGKITVNGKEHAAYFARPVLQMILKQPLVTAKREGQFDIVCTVSGGGLSGQADSITGAPPSSAATRAPSNGRNTVGPRLDVASSSPSARLRCLSRCHSRRKPE